VVFERFTNDARRVVVQAKEEAQRRSQAEILPAHLLHAITDDSHGPAGRLLRALGGPRIRAELDSRVLPARTGVPNAEHVPFAAATKKVVEAATAAADELRHPDISSLHLLLGLVQDTGVVGELLARHGIAREQIRRGFTRSGEVLRDVPLHGTVVRALNAAASAGRRPVGTLDLLVALMRADNAGEWHRIWLHCGNDEALAAMPFQDPDQGLEQDGDRAVGGRWEQVPLTGACATALEVAARLADRYDMRPLPPGLLALALVTDDTSGASRALGQGLGRVDLLDLLQRAILGTTLSGLATTLPQILKEVNRERAAMPREHPLPPREAPRPIPPKPAIPPAVPAPPPAVAPTPAEELFAALQRAHREAGAPEPHEIAQRIRQRGVGSEEVTRTLFGPQVPTWNMIGLVLGALYPPKSTDRNRREHWNSSLRTLWTRARASAPGAGHPGLPPGPPPGPVLTGPALPGHGPRGPWPAAITCPRHGTQEMVRAVPAVCSEGTAQTDSFGPVVGVAGGHLFTGVSRRTGTVQTDLARQLSPRPQLSSAAPMAILAILVGGFGGLLVMFGMAANGQFHDGSGDGPASFGVVLLVIGAMMLIPVAAKSSEQAKVERGLSQALEVWRNGLYCGRCGGVFFVAGTEPANVAPGSLLHPAHFQQLVWAAGGYGSLPALTARS
jgi:hypothetical protein